MGETGEGKGTEERVKRKKTGGRVAHFPPLRRRNFRLADEDVKLLRKWGRGNVSAGLRWLIAQAKELVYKPKENEDKS